MRVNLGSRSYDIVVRSGLIDDFADALPPRSSGRYVVVADSSIVNIVQHIAQKLNINGPFPDVITIPGGERAKTWTAAGDLLERLAAAGVERSDCLIIVGGGTVGDLAGFVSATYLRGIDYIHVPTTLLAMVDSAIGGKTGVNLSSGKNLAGVMWQPRAVLCDAHLLESLPERPYRAALGEIIKYAMIVDTPLVDMLTNQLDAILHRDLDVVAAVINECCAIKAAVVSTDEREEGRRTILNYGHTIGHAVESATGYGDDILHGEAVAVGMRVAGQLSINIRGCPQSDIAWQDALLARCGIGSAPSGIDADMIFTAMRSDKKKRDSSVRWVLLDRRGVATTDHQVPEAAVRGALKGVFS